jgi:hypothetical protein
MNSKLIWSDQIPERDGVKSSVNDIAISPGMYTIFAIQIYFAIFINFNSNKDGSKIIVAVGNRVLLYKSENFNLINK